MKHIRHFNTTQEFEEVYYNNETATTLGYSIIAIKKSYYDASTDTAEKYEPPFETLEFQPVGEVEVTILGKPCERFSYYNAENDITVYAMQELTPDNLGIGNELDQVVSETFIYEWHWEGEPENLNEIVEPIKHYKYYVEPWVSATDNVSITININENISNLEQDDQQEEIHDFRYYGEYPVICSGDTTVNKHIWLYQWGSSSPYTEIGIVRVYVATNSAKPSVGDKATPVTSDTDRGIVPTNNFYFYSDASQVGVFGYTILNVNTEKTVTYNKHNLVPFLPGPGGIGEWGA